jgi:hypothetical protein
MQTCIYHHTTAAQAGAAPAPGPVNIALALACAMDRAADAALFYGRASLAERLSLRAAELREAATCS